MQLNKWFLKWLPEDYRKEIPRFILIGISNTAIDFSVFFMLVQWTGTSYVISQVIGYSCGILNSFLLNRAWTFRTSFKERNTAKELSRFIGVNVVTLLMSVSFLTFLIEYIALNSVLAKLIVILISQTFNYIGYKFWVFAKGKSMKAFAENND